MIVWWNPSTWTRTGQLLGIWIGAKAALVTAALAFGFPGAARRQGRDNEVEFALRERKKKWTAIP